MTSLHLALGWEHQRESLLITSEGNGWSPDGSNEKVDAKRFTPIDASSLPYVLSIELHRYRFKKRNEKHVMTKVCKKLEFPPVSMGTLILAIKYLCTTEPTSFIYPLLPSLQVLDMTPYCQKGKAQDTPDKVEYRLCYINIHDGRHPNSGECIFSLFSTLFACQLFILQRRCSLCKRPLLCVYVQLRHTYMV